MDSQSKNFPRFASTVRVDFDTLNFIKMKLQFVSQISKAASKIKQLAAIGML